MIHSDVSSKIKIEDYINSDLVSFNVLSSSNKEYGLVLRVLGSKITTLLEISYNEKTYLVPLNEHFIHSINLKDKKIVVNNIEEISDLWFLIF